MRAKKALDKQSFEEFPSVRANFDPQLPEGVTITSVAPLRLKPPNDTIVLGSPVVDDSDNRGVLMSVAGGEHKDRCDVEVEVTGSDGGIYGLDCPIEVND